MRAPVLLLLAVPALVVGCGGDRVGGSGVHAQPGRTVTLAFGDDVAAGVAASFAAAVDRASRGSLRIRLRRVPESALAADLDGGAADLVVAPTYVWEGRERVPAAAALDAPLVFADEAQLDRAIAGPAGRAVIRSLHAAGAVGLAVLPVGLERPISELDSPTSAPAWHTTVDVPRSPPIVAAVAALGATPHPYERDAPPSLEQHVEPIVIGPLSEVTRLTRFAPLLDLAALTSNGWLTVVMDTAVGSDVMALAVSHRSYARLTPADRRTLEIAAHQSAARWPSAAARATALLTQACALDVNLAVAGAANVAAMRRPLRPLLTRLARDPLAAIVLRGIQSARPPSAPAVTCASGAAVGVAPPAALDGIYALDGVGERSSAGARLVIEGGRFSASGPPFAPQSTRVQVVTGDVTGSAGGLTFHFGRSSAGSLTFSWSLFDDLLRVTPSTLGSALATPTSTRIWRRVAAPHRVGAEVGTYAYGGEYLVLAGPANDYRYAGTTPRRGGDVRWLGRYRFDGHVLELDPTPGCGTCPAGGRFDWTPEGGDEIILWPHPGTPPGSYWATPAWLRVG